MALQYAVYNDDYTEAGKFYLVEVNKDNVSNVRLTTSITEPIAQNTARILALETSDGDYNDRILDNTARINNLEDEDLRSRLLQALELSTIRKNFSNSTNIEIEFGRPEIISIKVYVLIGDSGGKQTYTEISNSVRIDQERTATSKKIIIRSNDAISGYCLIL